MADAAETFVGVWLSTMFIVKLTLAEGVNLKFPLYGATWPLCE